MITVSENQVLDSINADDAFEAVRTAHVDLAEGIATNNPRSRARLPGFSIHSMSACSSSLGLAAAKVYGATASGIDSWVLLFSTKTGELLANISANALGKLRTTAASSLAASLLLNESKEIELGLIGSGYQSQGILQAFSAKNFSLRVTRARVFSRSPEKLKIFCEQNAKAVSFPIEVATSAADAASGAEIIVTATTSSREVIDETMVSSARVICALGANALSRRELSPRIVSGAKYVVVDEIETAKREAGDLLSPIEAGRLNWNQVHELGDIIVTPLPKQDSGYSVFCSQGLAVQDLYLAARVYQQSKSQADETSTLSLG